MTIIVIDHYSHYNLDINKLDEERKKKALSYQAQTSKQEVIASSLILYDILKNYFNLDINDVEYVYSENGKPYFKGNPVYFSISHSNGYCAVGVSDNEIGLDIEMIRDVPKLVYDKLFNDSLYDSHKFYTKWTQIEAYTKYLGSTIGKCLNSNIGVPIKTYELKNGCILSVNENINIKIIERF